MSNSTGTHWRFLAVEDYPVTAGQLQEECPRMVEPPDSASIEVCSKFKDALERLSSSRYDLLIIDLGDDESHTSETESLPGLDVFEELKRLRFVPVIFYTAHPNYVRSKETAFIRIVEKTEGLKRLGEEVQNVLRTHLPTLTRQIEEMQRSYMWDFVTQHWNEFESSQDQADLGYLLTRRLVLSLKALAGEIATKLAGSAAVATGDRTIHPMEMYVRPAIGPGRIAGDILYEKTKGSEGFWLVLTPSCDFEHGKADYAVLAKCEDFLLQTEYRNWAANAKAPTKAAIDKLESLVSDNRDGQRDRFKFLPSTFFLPNLLVDFQQLRSIPIKDLESFEVVASLDSPFAESVLARFSRYFGRLGTPDIDKPVVFKRLEALANSKVADSSAASQIPAEEIPRTASEDSPTKQSE